MYILVRVIALLALRVPRPEAMGQAPVLSYVDCVTCIAVDFFAHQSRCLRLPTNVTLAHSQPRAGRAAGGAACGAAAQPQRATARGYREDAVRPAAAGAAAGAGAGAK